MVSPEGPFVYVKACSLAWAIEPYSLGHTGEGEGSGANLVILRSSAVNYSTELRAVQ